MSEDEIKDAIKDGISTAAPIAGAAALGTNYAMEGGAAGGAGAAANVLLEGGEIAGGAAVGGVVFAAASVVGAGALGYRIGTEINEATGASEKYAQAVNAADQAAMIDARHHWEDAQEEAAQGDNIGTYVDVVLTAGGLAKATDEAVLDGLEDSVGQLGADIVTDIL